MTFAATASLLSLSKRRSCQRTTFTSALMVIIVVSALCLWSYQREVTYFILPCGSDQGHNCSVKPLISHPALTDGNPTQDTDGASTSGSTKRILFWVPFFNSPDYYFGLGRKPFSRCPVSNCETTTNRSLLADSDAILFHIRNTFTSDLPPWRSPSQRWVFFLMESPSNTFTDLRPFRGIFNWTMTYRTDSDIVIQYAYVRPIPPNEQLVTGGPAGNWSAVASKPQKPLSTKKRRLASWLVSHCHTDGHREDYIDELRNHMPVDIFGKCYGRPCDKDGECQERILQDYKFYLAFENSICRDYVTEKFYKVLWHDTVPVVYGGADYAAVGPPDSYIDARAFASPRHLADFLKMLDKNATLYRSYFSWKTRYRVLDDPFYFCDLCAKLHETTAASDAKVYDDIDDWWVAQGNCTS